MSPFRFLFPGTLAVVMVIVYALTGCMDEPSPTPMIERQPDLTSEPTATLTRTSEPVTILTPTTEVLDYFLEIALGAEFGDQTPVIRKWSSGPRIQVHGNPTAVDLSTLAQVILELNELVGGLRLELVQDNANLDVHFKPQSEFPSILKEYEPGNAGYFWTCWSSSSVIYKAIILIASDRMEEVRSHLIREELTQALGLMRDSNSRPDSIFYQQWSTVAEYSDIDREVIRILYLDDVAAGMTLDEVLALFAVPD